MEEEEIEVEEPRLIVQIHADEFDDVLALFEEEENPLPLTTVPDQLIPFLKENCDGEEENPQFVFFQLPNGFKIFICENSWFPEPDSWDDGMEAISVTSVGILAPKNNLISVVGFGGIPFVLEDSVRVAPGGEVYVDAGDVFVKINI